MTEDFFAGLDQVELKVDGGTAKFPIFYRDARFFAMLLPAKWTALRRMLPDARFAPAQVLPGVGAMALIALEYYDTDIAPYNEFMVGTILNAPHYAAVPGYNLLRQYLDGCYEAYVNHLPVTTEIALRAGRDFYNYPKFIGGIDFIDSPESLTCDLSRDGQHIMSLTTAKLAAKDMGQIKFFCNLYQYRQPQRAEFKVNALAGAMKWLPSDVSWAFNRSSEIGREVADAVIGSRALASIYMPRIQAILYGPEYMPIPLMQRTVTSDGFMPRSAPARKPAAKKPATKKASKAAKKKSSKPPKP